MHVFVEPMSTKLYLFCDIVYFVMKFKPFISSFFLVWFINVSLYVLDITGKVEAGTEG